MAARQLARCFMPISVIITGLIVISYHDSSYANENRSQPANSGGLQRAEDAFKRQNYDHAIVLLRAHLRRNTRDFHAWNLLAASYYHTGLPQRALRHFRNVYRHSPNKSYNLFYQGLCYQLLQQPARARVALTNSARFIDKYGSRATFELALMEYNARDNEKATYWLNLYRQRYPQGEFISTVNDMVRSISQGTFISDIEGNIKPDMERALFRYNRYSLSERPHFWFVQLGSNYEDSTQRVPTQTGATESRPVVSYQLHANAGAGIGPIRAGDSLAWAGYTYRQEWNTDPDRIKLWQDDPFDTEHQALRTDVMERTHQVFGDYRRSLSDNLFLGLYGRFDFVRGGSSLFASSDGPVTQRTARIAERNVFIPWIGINYLENYYTLFYLYFRKEINADFPQFSNQTYDLFESDTPHLSYGISHSMIFPQHNLTVNIEAFLYEFVYNDIWLDYSRLGAIIAARYEFYPRFLANAIVGFYDDTYQVPRLKQASCSFVPSDGEGRTEASSIPVSCAREDSGQMMGIGLQWNLSQFRRLEFSYLQVTNKNSQQNVYDKTSSTFLVTATFAFPSVERVARYVERFADTAFTKEAE